MLSTRQIVGFAASFGAATLAVAALAVSIVETRIMREEQHMSVWPRLVSGTSGNDNAFQIIVQNKGLGPAQVRAVRIATDSGTYRDWTDAFAAMLGRVPPAYSFSTVGNAVLMPGETMRPVIVPPGPDVPALHLASEKLRVDICYCSAYEDCWWLSDSSIGAARSHQSIRAVAACEIPESERFDM